MTTNNHPITPPPELVQQWLEKARQEIGTIKYSPMETYHYLATQAARWGADTQLEACEKWVASHFDGMMAWSATLRAAMRPKPPSLKEQALARTDAILNDSNHALLIEVREILELNRRALEQLDD